MDFETSVFVLFAMFIAGGVLVVVSGMRHRAKVLAMAHRERLAMIERGITPPADLLASGFGELEQRRRTRSTRLLSGGIMVVGLGLAIAMLLAFASREPEIAIGVGGAIVMIGLACIVTAYISGGRSDGSEPSV
jgi:peptidoglycan/LPS O-acetylase OafA/YrhL